MDDLHSDRFQLLSIVGRKPITRETEIKKSGLGCMEKSSWINEWIGTFPKTGGVERQAKRGLPTLGCFGIGSVSI